MPYLGSASLLGGAGSGGYLGELSIVGGIPLPGGTPGGVVFIDALGNLDDDAANFYWDDVLDFLGIGTNTPTSPLHIDHAGVPQQEIHNPAALSGAATLYTTVETGPGLGNGLLVGYDAGAPGGRIYLYENESLFFSTNGNDQWEIDALGNLLPFTDATRSLGSATRQLDDAYIADSIRMGSGLVLLDVVGAGQLLLDCSQFELDAAVFQITCPLWNQGVGLVEWSLGGGGVFSIRTAASDSHWIHRPAATTAVAGWDVKTTSGGVGGVGLYLRHAPHEAVVGATVGAGTLNVGHSSKLTDPRVAISGENIGYQTDYSTVSNTTARRVPADLSTLVAHDNAEWHGPIQEIKKYGRFLATSNAVATTIWTETLPATGAWSIWVYVTAQRTNGADRASYWRRGLIFRQGAGIATVQGIVQTPTPDIESTATYDVTLGVDGANNARVQVSGAALHNVDWQARIEILEAT
jgi:hypothetical protein